MRLAPTDRIATRFSLLSFPGLALMFGKQVFKPDNIGAHGCDQVDRFGASTSIPVCSGKLKMLTASAAYPWRIISTRGAEHRPGGAGWI
jgi:hypothetical protein